MKHKIFFPSNYTCFRIVGELSFNETRLKHHNKPRNAFSRKGFSAICPQNTNSY